MQVKESIRTSLEEIRAHKLRSMLTLSGVILGTVSLVVVLSLLGGVRAGVLKGFNDLGYDGVLYVSGKRDAIGEQITLSGRRLEVIGVVHKFDMTFVNDDDMLRETRGIYVPLSTYETIFGRNSVSYMVVKAAQFERAVEAEDETKSIMNRAHNGIKDTKVTNIGKEILEEREKVDVILRNWMIVFFSIAGVSLVIGGVGIFSVLKISIGERLYEIGLRKSMGASDGEIFLQFLIESITLSTIGAAIGGGLGVGLVLAIGSNFPGGLPISMPGILMAGGFAIGIGPTAGLYPSLVASRLEPVEALRA